MLFWLFLPYNESPALNGDFVLPYWKSKKKIKPAGKTGLDFAIELSKHIKGIEHIKLKENHRSGIVGDILDYIYGK